MLFCRGEHSHDALDCLRSIDGMECRENKMACRGRLERDSCWFPPMSSSAMRRVSSGPSGNNPVIVTGTNWPLTSICGRLPGEKIKSLTALKRAALLRARLRPESPV